MDEGKHDGEATLEAVKMIAELVKSHNCQLHPDCVEVRNPPHNLRIYFMLPYMLFRFLFIYALILFPNLKHAYTRGHGTTLIYFGSTPQPNPHLLIENPIPNDQTQFCHDFAKMP